MLDTAYAESKKILQDHRDQLESYRGELLRHAMIDAQTFKELIQQQKAARSTRQSSAFHPSFPGRMKSRK